MYNDQLVYKVVIWAFFEVSLWTEKVALTFMSTGLWTLLSPQKEVPIRDTMKNT